MKFTQSTWSLFQSPEVRDICDHLTADEKQRLLHLSAQYGRQTCWRSAVPFGLVAASFIYSVTTGFIVLALFTIYALLFERQRIRSHQQQVREMLCATEYARARNYRPDALRMFTFPWSHERPSA